MPKELRLRVSRIARYSLSKYPPCASKEEENSEISAGKEFKDPGYIGKNLETVKNIGQYKNEKLPTVTIITVVLNGEKNLENTILSVIQQSYSNIEYIIIDGRSRDKTINIIEKYKGFVDFWISEPDNGIYDAMNKGIVLASGDWINFMNSGDSFYSNNSVEEIFGSKDYEDVEVIYGDHLVGYPSGRVRRVSAGSIDDLWKGSQFCHQASFVRSEYHKARQFNPDLRLVADFDFFYKAWREGVTFKKIEIPLAICASGGVSDKRRLDVILGWRDLIETSKRSNFHYKILMTKEKIKSSGMISRLLEKFR